jgi:hypothetical protein
MSQIFFAPQSRGDAEKTPNRAQRFGAAARACLCFLCAVTREFLGTRTLHGKPYRSRSTSALSLRLSASAVKFSFQLEPELN